MKANEGVGGRSGVDSCARKDAGFRLKRFQELQTESLGAHIADTRDVRGCFVCEVIECSFEIRECLHLCWYGQQTMPPEQILRAGRLAFPGRRACLRSHCNRPRGLLASICPRSVQTWR